MIDWTPESVASLSREGLKSLRENALRIGEMKVVELCDTELAKHTRGRNKSQGGKGPKESRHGQYVSGLHFVCPRAKGVTTNSDGTIWTGTWVVDKKAAALGGRY